MADHPPRPGHPPAGAGTAPDAAAAPVDVLCRLFAEVLGLPGVDPDASFTGLGGDSIQAIQVVGRARRAGLVLATREVLRSESVRALAAGARTAGPSGAAARRAGPVRRLGPFPATPIMDWLAETAAPGVPADSYHQSLVLRTPAALGRADAVRILQALTDHHDLLRLRVEGGTGARPCRPAVPPPGSVDAARVLDVVDARDVPEDLLPELTGRHIRAAARLLSPADGAVHRAVLLDRGPAVQGRLALVVHHLSVDGVSWRILQEDLKSCWQDLLEGRDPAPAPVTTPFAEWAALLRADALSGRRTAEAAYWHDTLRPAPEPLAGTSPHGPLDADCPDRTLTLTLPAEVTAPLLTRAPAAVNGTVDDVLLTGLALAVLAWRRPYTGPDDSGAVLVDVEGHGRQDITDGTGADAPDPSRTVGWFTTVHPVRLDLGRTDPDAARTGGPTTGDALRRVKEALRAVPDKGIGHGLLRHTNPRTAPGLTRAGVPELGFNYLGRFPVGGTADWEAAPGHAFALDAAEPGMPLPHAVEVNAAAHEGPDGPALTATWTWSGNAYDADRVRALAEEWFAMLRAVADHAGRPGAARLTPSDVSLAGLSQTDLDLFEDQLGAPL
ncbi:condensation domain-containing protein [Streptomyces sp. NPDC089799]|uniref:condensation domain-containing protein n=1 Tax=Streptomyces sp. NPDC089799 TaxID=3155066 RepID=UPI00342A9AEC